MAKMCSFFSQQGWKNLNRLWLRETQITSQQNIVTLGSRDQTFSQIDSLPSSRKATAVSGEARQISFFKQAKSRVKQTELAKHT